MIEDIFPQLIQFIVYRAMLIGPLSDHLGDADYLASPNACTTAAAGHECTCYRCIDDALYLQNLSSFPSSGGTPSIFPTYIYIYIYSQFHL